MSCLETRFVSFIERRARVLPLRKARTSHGGAAIPPRSTIAVIGGGLAGPAFARRSLCLAEELGIPLQVELLTHASCNYCAGLITDLALKTMQDLYESTICEDLIRESIVQVVYLNNFGEITIPLASPLTSVLRTNKFKQKGFDDFWIDSVFQGLSSSSSFNSRRDVRVTEVRRNPDRGGFRIFYEQGNHLQSLEADYVVIAAGLKCIQQPFMQNFIRDFGYQPPELVDSCVTEINTGPATQYSFQGRVLVIDGIVENCLVAFIPKGREWLTVTGLGKVLTEHDLERLFNNALVKKYVRLENVADHLRCRKICSASVVGQPAGNFFGDGWVMIGDLTGYGRALKDGYFAALKSADLAARTLLCHGPTKESFREHFFESLKKIALDNRVGMCLYRIDQKVINGPIGNLLLRCARTELAQDPYGGLVVAAFRALFSGELSYKTIMGLFAAGISAHLVFKVRL